MKSAIAIDLGATSIRFAHGTFDGDSIGFQTIEQVSHQPLEWKGHPVWDIDLLKRFCQKACGFAAQLGPETTVGIDSWGVDHGFIDDTGRLVQPPIAYRDPAHQKVFDEFADSRRRLYERTGIAHQPFNTIYQLIARGRENPALKSKRWLILPELLAQLLGAEGGHEWTQASTTQLMDTNGQWSDEAFQIAGWPKPLQPPCKPGGILGRTGEGVPIVRVGSHDTASAVLGLGTLEEDEAFLNVGTWSLLGCVLDRPLTTPSAQEANFSNEWMVDGRIRFLKNIPGFYIINRLHEELHVGDSIPDWIERADQSYGGRIDPLAPEFFNPASMQETVRAGLDSDPPTSQAWGGVALMSLCECTVRQLDALETLAGRRFAKIRVAGGGSRSRAFCEALATVSSRAVVAGPNEATVVGNLGAQFLAQGAFSSWADLGAFLRQSQSLETTFPGV